MGPTIESVMGMKMKALAQPNTMIPVHILKKTTKKYDSCYIPAMNTAIAAAMIPCSMLEPIRLKATYDFHTRYFLMGSSSGGSISR